ncbi:MAG: CHAD domain-containing protein [Alphaproteobacteria bacterium]|nr:CHAD domain-containing protein [Alphaproteobacteria bacterium]MBV9372188.1 CHAD domain-containing protein [Alphaproteobacteria bacterium]MBV9902319.1 CHAD domain-containing protein [Alphaproteobacteria bacterium]
MIETQEVELKLELPVDCVEAFREAAAANQSKRRSVRQTTTYFDTPKGHLRKAGYSLRIRRKGSVHLQTVKERGADSGGFSSRSEWEQRIEGSELDFAALRGTPVGALLSKRDARKRLAVVSETRVRRTTWLVRGGRSTIEMILDEGEVVSGGRCVPLCEVELELKKGRPSDLFALARALALRVPLRMGVTSKSERGFRLLEGKANRVRKAEPVKLSRDSTIAQAFATIVQSCLRHFRLNEEILLKERNASALHQARVAMRRLRSALTLFKPVVADEEFERIRSELRWFTGKLGEARNLDVLIAGDAGLGGEREAAQFRKDLRQARKAAYAGVGDALRDPRFLLLVLDLVAWSEVGAWRSLGRAGHPIPEFACERLEKGWRRARKAAADMAASSPEERHRLRIDVKKLRYAAEFFASLAPKDSKPRQRKFLDRLEAMQESLGKLNDVETAKAIAPELAAQRDDPAASAELLAQAQQAYAQLKEIGRYWR